MEIASGGVNFEFGGLYEQLGLNASQIARFGELVRGTDFFGEWGRDGEFLEFHVPSDVTNKERDQELRALLGEAGLRKYREFRGTAPARAVTAQLASQLSLTDSPLTAEQASQTTGPASQPQSSKKSWSSVSARIANGIARTTACTASAFQKSRAFKGADTRLARLGG